MLPQRVHRRFKKLPSANASKLYRVLHRKEDAGFGTILWEHLEDVFPLENYFSAGHGVLRPACDDVGESALA